jgi:hypothetical protein
VDWISRGLDGLFRLWERGQALLWALAIICAVIFAILFVGAFFGIAGTGVALESYGLWFVLGGAALGIFAIIRTIEGRYRPPSVHLIANNAQSFWSQSRQPDGRIATQLAIRLRATNLTHHVITLSEARLIRPWVRARVLANVLVTIDPNLNVNVFSHENPISPRAISEVACTYILDGAIGWPGRPMIAVFKISDQFGQWHKVKFRLVDSGPHDAPLCAARFSARADTA